MCVLELVTYHFFLPWDFIFPGLRLRGVPSSKNALGGLTPSVLLVRLQCYRVFEPCTFMEGGMNHGHNPSFWLFECACCLFLDLVFCHGLSLICKESCCARTISSKCFRCVLLALLFLVQTISCLELNFIGTLPLLFLVAVCSSLRWMKLH